MFKDIISIPETKYLGFGLMMPWENNLEIQFNLWKDGFVSGKINKLKELCGSEQVVGVFCYKCDMEKQTFSYHIVCENKLNALSSEFEELKLEAINYARFENNCTDVKERFIKYDALCNEICQNGYALAIFFLKKISILSEKKGSKNGAIVDCCIGNTVVRNMVRTKYCDKRGCK